MIIFGDPVRIYASAFVDRFKKLSGGEWSKSDYSEHINVNHVVRLMKAKATAY
jgi:hypothetical protein